MYIDNEKLKSSFNEWENKLNGYSLPDWDNLPTIDLYMDQVISLLSQYLQIYYEVTSVDKILTPSMINNYVKLNIIPAPHKKKYSRVHLVYLIVVCTLKQTLDMATIQKILPLNITDEEVKQTYNSFIKNQHKAYLYVLEKVNEVAAPILELEGNNQERMNDIVMQVASSANIFKILTENITKLMKEN